MLVNRVHAPVLASLAFALLLAGKNCLADDGTIWAWPDNRNGNQPYIDVPSDLGPVMGVSAGGMFSIATVYPGTVRCWGDNAHGQCDIPSDLGIVRAVEGGFRHSIAIRLDGSLRCWGDNTYGECNVPAGTGFAAEADAGNDFSVAAFADGTVRCWGRNNQGQCNSPSLSAAAIAVSACVDHAALLLTTGTARCWGRNVDGQCNVPSSLPLLQDVQAGGAFTIALTQSGGVTGWGYNWNVGMPNGLSGVVRIAAGSYAKMALLGDGSIRVWGGYVYGEDDIPAGVAEVVSMAAGNRFALAAREAADLDSDGILNASDNCRTVPNSLQADCDHDGIGDACEAVTDCNGNGVDDDCDIALGNATDFNSNGIPDVCECASDLNADHRVNGADLGVLLAFWGPRSTSFPAADLTNDGVVNGADLGMLLSGWGSCP